MNCKDATMDDITILSDELLMRLSAVTTKIGDGDRKSRSWSNDPK